MDNLLRGPHGLRRHENRSMTEPTFDWTDCDAVVRRLWPHLDGALTDAERGLILRHLETCGGCTAQLLIRSRSSTHRRMPSSTVAVKR